jgi:hypothetical protein
VAPHGKHGEPGLLVKMEAGDVEATETAIDVVAYNCLERKTETGIPLDRGDVRESAWRVVERAARNVGRESHWWAKIIESLVPYDLARAAKVAASGEFTTAHLPKDIKTL